MNVMKETRKRQEHGIRLRDFVGDDAAWGTELGIQVFARINRDLAGLSQGALVLVDYRGLERSDSSFQREAVVETLRKHRPRLLFVGVNLSDADMTTNLELALEKRGECLVVRSSTGATVIGKPLAAEVLETLKLASRHGELASTMLTRKPWNLEPSTASSRLTALWKAGLLERVEGVAASGGREYRYYPVE